MKIGKFLKVIRGAIRMTLAAAGLVGFAFPGRADAIPAFARSISAPCIVCHTGYPKLNSFGFEYKQRGYRMPGQSNEGKFLWEQPIPLSGRINLSAAYETDRWKPEITGIAGVPSLTAARRSRFALDDWQFLTGGTLAPRISFLGTITGRVQDLESGPTGTAPADGASTDLDTDLFLVQINDLIPNAGLNVRLGKDHIDNYYLSSRRRLTRADYLIQIQPALGASLSSSSVGAEANGFVPIGLRYAAGIRNFSSSYIVKEDDAQRIGAYYAWASQKVEGQTASVMIAGDRVGDANLGTDDTALGYGASFNFFIFGTLNIVPGIFWYQEGGDAHGGRKLEVMSGTLEVIYPFSGNLWGTLRYDFHDRKDIRADAEQIVASVAWYPFWHVRWVAEISRLAASNLLPSGSPVALLTGTPADSDLTRHAAALLFQVDF